MMRILYICSVLQSIRENMKTRVIECHVSPPVNNTEGVKRRGARGKGGAL
jgi:hypothetical protein